MNKEELNTFYALRKFQKIERRNHQHFYCFFCGFAGMHKLPPYADHPISTNRSHPNFSFKPQAKYSYVSFSLLNPLAIKELPN